MDNIVQYYSTKIRLRNKDCICLCCDKQHNTNTHRNLHARRPVVEQSDIVGQRPAAAALPLADRLTQPEELLSDPQSRVETTHGEDRVESEQVGVRDRREHHARIVGT